jgi:chorismate lyase
MPSPLFSCHQKSWLTGGDSLTQRLQRLGHVEVCLVREAAGFAWGEEAVYLGMRTPLRVWIREVVLRVARIPMVVARSIIPLSCSRRAWRTIRQLDTKPLGEILYRTPIVCSRRTILGSRNQCMDGRNDLDRFVRHCLGASDTKPCFVTRRSVFICAGAPLLLTECLMQALWSPPGQRQR